MTGPMRVATDIGGTFTDLVYYAVDPDSEASSAIIALKVDTTPPHFEEGVARAIAKAGLSPADIGFFAHGSTVVINALTERKGVKTGLITTRGFRDVLEIGRGNRPDLFNFRFRKPVPFVDRYLRMELDERVTFKGAIQREVDLAPLPEILAGFQAAGVGAIAVCFLHSYANPENERRTVAAIREAWPEISVLGSHEVSREWREYERTSTTVLSAYVAPVTRAYLETMESRLVESGFDETPYLMQSNGGIASFAEVQVNPITLVESGPASGIYAAAHLGRQIGEPNLIVLDIGGTTAKCTLIDDGQIKISTDYYIERDRQNPGYPVQTPVCDIVEIGNGGGSIAWIDAGGKLHVGPQSAGSRPGPAAYGRGGTALTTTDANLILGRIDPASFAGGEIEPDWVSVDAAVRPLAEGLGLSREELARGVVRIANANMTNALRLVSTNKGYDPRDFALIAFGGGGAMHAVALGDDLRVAKVIVPANSSAFSALGMLLTDLRRDVIRTQLTPVNDQTLPTIRAIFAEIVREVSASFGSDGAVFEYRADLRYLGQEHTVNVPFALDIADPVAVAIQAFHAAHEKRFTYRLESQVQLVNFHIVAVRAIQKPQLAERVQTGRAVEQTRLGERDVDFDTHGVHRAAIHDGLLLEPGMTIAGPAVIQEASMTLPVRPGARVEIDTLGNYLVYLA